MNLTKKEAAVAWVSITQNEQNQPRTFALAQLADASSIVKKLKTSCTNESGEFKDGDVEFGTDEKKLLLDCSDRAWGALDGEAALSLRDKLK